MEWASQGVCIHVGYIQFVTYVFFRNYILFFAPFSVLLTHDSCSNRYFSVSERILARDPMDEIRRAFQLFDDDNTGKISLRNLRRVAKEIGDRLEDDEL